MTKSTFLSNTVDGLLNTPRYPSKTKNRRANVLGNLLALLIAVALIGSADGVSATMKQEPSGIQDLLFGAAGTGKIVATVGDGSGTPAGPPAPPTNLHIVP